VTFSMHMQQDHKWGVPQHDDRIL